MLLLLKSSMGGIQPPVSMFAVSVKSFFAFNTLDIISIRVVYSVYKFPLHLLALDVKWLIPRS